MEEANHIKKSCQFFFVGILTFLGLFGIFLFSLPQHTFSENENRYLTTFQPVTLYGFLDGSVQKNLEDGANDQFLGRDFWVRSATALKRGSGFKDIGGVYIGKDGQYFERLLDSDIPMDRYLNNLRYIERCAEDTGKKVTFLPIPSAATILPDLLPDYAVSYQAAGLFDQAKELLHQASLLDIRKDLSAARSEHQIYFKTDHHWTMYGAYTAYAAWCSAHGILAGPLGSFAPECASNVFYGTLYSKAPGFFTTPDALWIPKDLPSTEVVIDTKKKSTLYVMEKLQSKDKYGIYFGGNFGQVDIINTDADNDSTLLVIKDSFANSMIPFLIGYYKKIIMLDLRYFNGSVSELIKKDPPEELLILYEISDLAQDMNFFKLIK